MNLAEGLGDDRKPTKKMAEAMILAQLYKDGFFIVDDEAKTAKINMRRDEIAERYKEESVADILDIMERTATGLDMAGYTVKKERLVIDDLKETLSKSTLDLDDGFNRRN